MTTRRKTSSRRKAATRRTATSTKRSTTTRNAKYTKPALRARLKRAITAGAKGGKPGQWSARKAQLLAHEYAEAGGGYRGKKTRTQKHLAKWTREDWTTSDGKPARRKGGTSRYLPKNAWRSLDKDERRATNDKKRAGSRKGKQFVKNTRKAAKAGKRARRASS